MKIDIQQIKRARADYLNKENAVKLIKLNGITYLLFYNDNLLRYEFFKDGVKHIFSQCDFDRISNGEIENMEICTLGDMK